MVAMVVLEATLNLTTQLMLAILAALLMVSAAELAAAVVVEDPSTAYA
jgi:hypothetical protein